MERIKADSIGTSCTKASFKHICSKQYPRVRRNFTPIKEFKFNYGILLLYLSLTLLSICCAVSTAWVRHETLLKDQKWGKYGPKKKIINWHNSLIIVKFLSVPVSYSHTPMLEDVLQILMQTVRLFSRLTDVYYSVSTVMRFPSTAGTVRDV